MTDEQLGNNSITLGFRGIMGYEFITCTKRFKDLPA